MIKQYTYMRGFDVRGAIRAGLEAWDEVNSGLVFIQPLYKARLKIKIYKLSDGQAGLGTPFTGSFITMPLPQHVWSRWTS